MRRSGSCSSTNCVYGNHSKRASVQQLLSDGSRVDKLFYGKYIPLREKKVLEKLVRTRAVYDAVRNQLISTSGSSGQTRSFKKKKITSSDRGGIWSSNTSKLSSCCNCSSCASLKKIKARIAKHPHVHRCSVPYENIAKYRIKAEKRANSRRRRLGSKLSSKMKDIHTKSIHSVPCFCTLSLMNLPVKKRRSNVKAQAELNEQLKPRHTTETGQSLLVTNMKWKKQIKKDSLSLFRNKLIKEKLRKRGKHDSESVTSQVGRRKKKVRHKLSGTNVKTKSIYSKSNSLMKSALTRIRIKNTKNAQQRTRRIRIRSQVSQIPFQGDVVTKTSQKKRKKSVTSSSSTMISSKSKFLNCPCEKTNNRAKLSSSQIKSPHFIKQNHAKYGLRRCFCTLKVQKKKHNQNQSNSKKTMTLVPFPHQNRKSKERKEIDDSKYFKNKSTSSYDFHDKFRYRERSQNLKRKNEHTRAKGMETHKVGVKNTRLQVSSYKSKPVNTFWHKCLCNLKLFNKDKISVVTTPKNEASKPATDSRRHVYKLQKLDPYECEPGNCVPDICDPKDCEKYIHLRDLQPKKQYPDENMNNGVLKEQSSSKTQTSSLAREKLKKTTHEAFRNPMAHDKEVVRIGSSVSFNMEFYKDRSPDTITGMQKHETPHRSPRKHKSSSSRQISKITRGSQPLRLITKPIAVPAEPKPNKRKNFYVGSPRKSCLCILKLHKKGRNAKIRDKNLMYNKKTKTNIDFFGLKSNTSQTKTNSSSKYIKQPIGSRECACDPDFFNNYAHVKSTKLKSIKRYRDRHISTIRGNRRSVMSMTSTETSGSRKSRSIQAGTIEKENQERKAIKSQEDIENIYLPSRQAVRIGSNFSFSVDFYKDRNFSDRRDQTITTMFSTVTNFKNELPQNNSEYKRNCTNYRLTDIQSIFITNSVTSHVSNVLKKGYHTFSPHKRALNSSNNNLDLPPVVTQLSENMPHYEYKKQVDNFFDALYSTSSNAQEYLLNKRESKTTKSNNLIQNYVNYNMEIAKHIENNRNVSNNPFHRSYYALNLKISQIYKKHVLKDDECEPGVCVPYQCDKEKCLKTIKSRLKGRLKQTETESTGFRDIASMTFQKSRSHSYSQADKHSVNKVFQPKKKIMRLGSNIKLNMSAYSRYDDTNKTSHQDPDVSKLDQNNYINDQQIIAYNNRPVQTPTQGSYDNDEEKCVYRKNFDRVRLKKQFPPRRENSPKEKEIKIQFMNTQTEPKLLYKSSGKKRKVSNMQTEPTLTKSSYSGKGKHPKARNSLRNFHPIKLDTESQTDSNMAGNRRKDEMMKSSGKFRNVCECNRFEQLDRFSLSNGRQQRNKRMNIRTDRATRVARSRSSKMPTELEKFLMKPPRRRVYTIGSNINFSMQFFKEDDALKLHSNKGQASYTGTAHTVTTPTGTAHTGTAHTGSGIYEKRRCFCTRSSRYERAKKTEIHGSEKSDNSTVEVPKPNKRNKSKPMSGECKTCKNKTCKTDKQVKQKCKYACAVSPDVPCYDMTTNTIKTKHPYECEPNICIPGKCSPKQCFQIFRSRHPSILTKDTAVSTTRKLKSVSIQSSDLISGSETKRCFCILNMINKQKMRSEYQKKGIAILRKNFARAESIFYKRKFLAPIKKLNQLTKDNAEIHRGTCGSYFCKEKCGDLCVCKNPGLKIEKKENLKKVSVLPEGTIGQKIKSQIDEKPLDNIQQSSPSQKLVPSKKTLEDKTSNNRKSLLEKFKRVTLNTKSKSTSLIFKQKPDKAKRKSTKSHQSNSSDDNMLNKQPSTKVVKSKVKRTESETSIPIFEKNTDQKEKKTDQKEKKTYQNERKSSLLQRVKKVSQCLKPKVMGFKFYMEGKYKCMGNPENQSKKELTTGSVSEKKSKSIMKEKSAVKSDSIEGRSKYKDKSEKSAVNSDSIEGKSKYKDKPESKSILHNTDIEEANTIDSIPFHQARPSNQSILGKRHTCKCEKIKCKCPKKRKNSSCLCKTGSVQLAVGETQTDRKFAAGDQNISKWRIRAPFGRGKKQSDSDENVGPKQTTPRRKMKTHKDKPTLPPPREPLFSVIVDARNMKVRNKDEIYRNLKVGCGTKLESQQLEEGEEPVLDVVINRDNANILRPDDIMTSIFDTYKHKFGRNNQDQPRRGRKFSCDEVDKSLPGGHGKKCKCCVCTNRDRNVNGHPKNCTCCICRYGCRFGQYTKPTTPKYNELTTTKYTKPITTKYNEPTTKHTKPTTKYTEPTTKPTKPTTKSTEPTTTKYTEPTTKPTKPTTKSTKPTTTKYNEPTTKPTTKSTAKDNINTPKEVKTKKPIVDRGQDLQKMFRSKALKGFSSFRDYAEDLKHKKCLCGNKSCTVERLKKEEIRKQHRSAKKPPPCICGIAACEKEYNKRTPYYHDKYVALLEKNKEKNKKVKNKEQKKIKDDKKISESAKARLKRYEQEDDVMRKRIKKQDAKSMKILKQYADHISDVALLAENTADIGKFSLNQIRRMMTCAKRYISHPSDIEYSYTPEHQTNSALKQFEAIGFDGTAARVKRRCAAMQTSKYLVAGLETHPFTNYLVHFRDKDPKKRLIRKLAGKKHRDPPECSPFMKSLRKKPCLWMYYSCPWFYPHCLSLLTFWRQFTDIVLFVLAVGVWSPCILLTEICRTFICCLMCSGGG